MKITCFKCDKAQWDSDGCTCGITGLNVGNAAKVCDYHMTALERYLRDNTRTLTIITLKNDWRERLDVVRRINGYPEDTTMVVSYSTDKNETTIWIRG